jgi:hypothetical protein
MRPIVEGLQGQYGEQVNFVYLNAQDGKQGEEAFSFYGLRGHPSLVFVRTNGEVSWIKPGISTRAALQTAIEQEITSP